VYFLPWAQSVPTVSTRLPLRLRPVAAPNFKSLCRTSTSRTLRRAALCTRSGNDVSRVCRPLTTSSPASAAALSSATQWGGSAPPVGAIPTTMEPAPRAAAACGETRGRPKVTAQPGRLHSPITSWDTNP